MAASTGARWAFGHGMWAFGADSPGEPIAAGRDDTLRGLAERIACPTLGCAAEADPFWLRQPEQLDAALTCPTTRIRFSAEEGVGERCNVGARPLFHQRAFDWLDDALR